MGVARYVNLSFIACGLIGWIVFAGLSKFAIELAGAAANRPIIGVNFRVADLLGLIAGVIFAVYLKRKYNTWAMEVGNELSRVTWPTWSEIRVATTVTIITTINIAMILGLFDYIWAQLSTWIYGL